MNLLEFKDATVIAGWTPVTQVSVLLDFIEYNCLEKDLHEYLKTQLRDEGRDVDGFLENEGD